jgi:hypothetical protein
MASQRGDARGARSVQPLHGPFIRLGRSRGVSEPVAIVVRNHVFWPESLPDKPRSSSAPVFSRPSHIHASGGVTLIEVSRRFVRLGEELNLRRVLTPLGGKRPPAPAT